jgi:autotransporter-associated beta strand protein
LGGAVFVQQGGTLTLAGAFVVNGNSVTAGGAGNVGAGNGSAFGSGLFLQGNGTVNFSPANGQTQTVFNTIADQTGSGGTGANAGSWALNVSGGGTLVLDGANAYSGGTTVTGATLVVNGSIGDPTINAGGVLTGTGVIGSTQINAGGTFAPGNGTPGTSMTIAGSLAFASGALYLVQINTFCPCHRYRDAWRCHGQRQFRPGKSCRQAIHHPDSDRRRQRHLRVARQQQSSVGIQEHVVLRRQRCLFERGARLYGAELQRTEWQPAGRRQRAD